MKIGKIDLGNQPVLLAPMEDVTDLPFRLLCKQFGADMVYTEFISSDALIREVNKTMQKLTIAEEERPVAIQIYGRDTESMVQAAKMVEQAKPDILDLNFGCPVKKVAGKGGGAGMLQNIPKMLEITEENGETTKPEPETTTAAPASKSKPAEASAGNINPSEETTGSDNNKITSPEAK